MKKEKIILWVFWIALLALIIPWGKAINRIQTNLKEEMSKTFLPAQEFSNAVVKVQAVVKADREKMKTGVYSAKDFHRAMFAFMKMEQSLREEYSVDRVRGEAMIRWRSIYGNEFMRPLENELIEKGQLPGLVMMQAQAEVWQENGFKGAIKGVITKSTIQKLLRWLFLFAWPISAVLAFFFYIARCQIRGISFKEVLLTSPLQFLSYSVFWLAGLAFNYPEGNLGIAKRYFKLKSRYMSAKDWGYQLTKKEEQLLWQQARAPVEKFNKGVEQTLAYSRVMALVSSLFIWLFVTPFTNLRGQDKVTVQVNPDTANLWYFHTPEKGLNFYFMRVWPSGYLLTKFGPPEIRISKEVSISLGVGPDLNVKAAKSKDFFESFTLDVVPAVFTGKFGIVLVNELGVDKHGKTIFFFRHSVSYGQIGLMWSSFGTFGEKAHLFRLGPTVKLGKLQFWAADDLMTGKWLVEASFSIKL